MIEKNIVDRVPTYAGRVKLTPVSGQADVFTMERADEPTEEGTPINKATLDSITQSRLTGRVYVPTVEQTGAVVNTFTANPIPASGWITDGTERATNGVYVTTSSVSQYNPAEAFDGTWSTSGGWRPDHDDDAPWIAIDLGSPIVLTRVKIHFISDAWGTNCTIAGSNNGTTWTDIATIERPTTNAAIEWSFTNATAYQHYRLSFDYTGIELYGWAFTEYTVTTYKNAFAVAAGFPLTWTTGQLVRIEIPSNTATLGIVSNTLNNVTVNTILQASKRYELRYTGTVFVAKEV